MKDELDRSRQLRVASTDPLYYIEYTLEDADIYSVNASLGALVDAQHLPLRVPTVHLRLGSPAFDNTDHVYSDYYSGTRYDPEQLPLDTNYGAIRQVFWLATDRAFKTAQEAIGRKRSALRNVNQAEQFPDFSASAPVQSIQPLKRPARDEALWKARVIKLSDTFTAYPQVWSSSLEFQDIQSTRYFLNSEGTTIRIPEDLVYLRIRAFAQAPDGMLIRDSDVIQSSQLSRFPSDLELKRRAMAVADELTALARAPFAESYDGPVLFEPKAAAQLFGQLLGDNLKASRRPVGEPGRQLPYVPSELLNKMGARVLPDWMDVADDPTQTEWRGQELFGHYDFDDEGVRPQALTLIEKGVLKTLLLTRTPLIKNLEATNGHARMHGGFGANAPGFGNLFVRASQSVSAPELKQKLIELVKQRNKAYGLLIRKLDFPSAMSVDELRRLAAGGTRVANPLLVYRVYPDGREELVRGLRFHAVSTKSFRDIVAASDDSAVFNFLDSPVPFALMGAGGVITNATVVSPGILFDELELEKIQDDLPKLPIVPPPPLTSDARSVGFQPAGRLLVGPISPWAS
jgi:hypothetical protein